MSMISELIERLRRYARWSKTNTPSWSQTMTEAADTIEKLSAKMSAENMERSGQCGWIPCEGRMPDADGFYLITAKGELVGQKEMFVSLGEFSDGEWVDDGDCILAWQPLPEPYKEM